MGTLTGRIESQSSVPAGRWRLPRLRAIAVSGGTWARTVKWAHATSSLRKPASTR